VSVQHYENFPVASWLCPARLRPAVAAIYWFARTADDLADEGDDPPAERLLALSRYRDELDRAARGQAPQAWPAVFVPLRAAIERHALPSAPLHALLNAFEQDVHNPAYPDRQALLRYCALSANPVGRLLLHLYGVQEPAALARSDAVCSALQLINFWQDLGIDSSRGRCYVPQDDARRHGVMRVELHAGGDSPSTRSLVRDLVAWARSLMNQGAPLVHQVPGRAGWELRAVVQGGLAVLDKIDRIDHAVLSQRPTLGALDMPRLFWRAARMSERAPAPAPIT
jgi:hydroxysqualene synthase